MEETLKIAIAAAGIEVPAELIAPDLGLAPADLPTLLRDESVTSLCEKGEGEDAGRWRLTFFTRTKRLRLIVDSTGAILQRQVIDFGDKPLPGSLHRTG